MAFIDPFWSTKVTWPVARGPRSQQDLLRCARLEPMEALEMCLKADFRGSSGLFSDFFQTFIGIFLGIFIGLWAFH